MSVDEEIPWVTWLSGGAALLLLIGTALLLLSGRTPATPGHGEMAAAVAPGATPVLSTATSAPMSEASARPAAHHPLDISAALSDARSRGALRFDPVALVRIRLIIEGGRPLGPLEITYGQARQRSLPGAAVTNQRLHISYDGARATPREETDRSGARSVPEPNCPLEAAFRAAVQAGAASDARTFAVYAHSERHDRPTWTLTAGSGGAMHVDGDSCALLRR